ncbi:FecR family protein [Pedobacter cryoconitis]|uniref:FecR family protein n=1 Tax=Pedobacter cryoconitis TaxID=188932 RepID=A0A327T439_9SPHI|nr:FecR domain-containing protein [Pedobacter cryoconitis]RAJ35642.1 FecR family protein [Pedobacter cryoconitis]
MKFPDHDFLVEELVCNDSFQQYCLGISLENHVLWEEWINSMPKRAFDIAQAKKMVNILTIKQGSRLEQVKALKSGFKQQEALAQLLHTVSDESIPGKQVDFNEKSGLKSSSGFYKYISFAAAAVIILVSLYFIQQSYSVSENIKVEHPFAASVFSSGQVPRKTVTLIDGTVITLHQNSEIKLAKNFNPAQRELWLTGEAFFEVKHDAKHPFIVHTPFNDIKVLGTSFNVKAYPHSGLVETSLIHGSVQVESKKYPGYRVLLKPDEKLSFYSAPASKDESLKNIFIVSSLNRNTETHQSEEIQWIHHPMLIDNEPLAAIAEKLQNWYGIEIYIADPEVKTYRYSGTFENESIIKTLEALQTAYPFEFKAEQNRIILSK